MKKVNGRPWKGRAYLHKKYPLAFPLSESQMEILDGLARSGPINPNKLRKSIGKAYSFVFNTLKELELRKVVTLHREKNEKGVYAKIYDLALEGVMLILSREMQSTGDKWGRSFVRKIIDRYRSLLPLVFGKWNHFEEMGVEKIATSRLKVMVDTYKRDKMALRKGTGIIPWMESEQQMCWFFYFQFHHFNFGERWLNALKQDSEIKEYVIKEMKAYQERLEELRMLIEKNLSYLEGHDGKKEAP